MIPYICGCTRFLDMNRTLLVVVLVFTVLMTSCIPHRDIVYLQDKGIANDSLQVMVEKQKPYRIQINDILNVRIKVMDQENAVIFNPIGDGNLNASAAERAYFDGFTVDSHGNIRIPELGFINVLGFTTEEVENIIKEQLLKDQFKETANIFVTVKLAGLRYTTVGEISRTGSQVLFQDRVNIYEAVANAGDIPITGDKKDVMVVRQFPQGQEIYHLDLTDVEVMKSPHYYIQPNDMIYVKPLKQKTWGTGTTGRESLMTIVSALSLVTTTILLINRL